MRSIISFGVIWQTYLFIFVLMFTCIRFIFHIYSYFCFYFLSFYFLFLSLCFYPQGLIKRSALWCLLFIWVNLWGFQQVVLPQLDPLYILVYIHKHKVNKILAQSSGPVDRQTFFHPTLAPEIRLESTLWQEWNDKWDRPSLMKFQSETTSETHVIIH